MKAWMAIRGYIAGVAAFIVCPCHLPLTLPLLLILTAGTTVGGWLAINTTIIYIASFAFFIGGLLLAGRWLRASETEACVLYTTEV